MEKFKPLIVNDNQSKSKKRWLLRQLIVMAIATGVYGAFLLLLRDPNDPEIALAIFVGLLFEGLLFAIGATVAKNKIYAVMMAIPAVVVGAGIAVFLTGLFVQLKWPNAVAVYFIAVGFFTVVGKSNIDKAASDANVSAGFAYWTLFIQLILQSVGLVGIMGLVYA